LLEWFRSLISKRKSPEPASQSCVGCRASILGATEEELFFSGGVLLPGVGWFCGIKCESQYRLRFRIQPAVTPGGGVPHATAGKVRPRRPTGNLQVLPAQPEERTDARSAEEVLSAVLRSRRGP